MQPEQAGEFKKEEVRTLHGMFRFQDLGQNIIGDLFVFVAI